MTRFAHIAVPLTLLGLALAAPAPGPALASEPPSTTTELRVNDLVVLDGTNLRFDPVAGLDETTRDPDWQMDYMKSLLSYETEQDLTERGAMLEKRISTGAQCVSPFHSSSEKVSRGTLIHRNLTLMRLFPAPQFECMVGMLKVISKEVRDRRYVLGICSHICGGYSLSTIKSVASRYAVELGWDWGNGPRTENKDIWLNTK